MTKKEFKAIRFALLKKGFTFQMIAKELHTSKQVVSLAVHMKRDSQLSKDIRDHIESIIGRLQVWHIKNQTKTTN